jgi:hypothetical protein
MSPHNYAGGGSQVPSSTRHPRGGGSEAEWHRCLFLPLEIIIRSVHPSHSQTPACPIERPQQPCVAAVASCRWLADLCWCTCSRNKAGVPDRRRRTEHHTRESDPVPGLLGHTGTPDRQGRGRSVLQGPGLLHRSVVQEQGVRACRSPEVYSCTCRLAPMLFRQRRWPCGTTGRPRTY